VLDSIISLLRTDGVSHIAVATDHVIESFRNDLYDGYKTGAGIEPDLWQQFHPLEEALRTLGATVWPMVEFEADDALAAAAAKFGGEVDQVQIMTPDKDLAQCVVDSKVVLVDRRRRITYDADGVREKWGVDPESIPDYLALVGDSADGYAGLPGWGAKSAAAVLTRYEHLESIPDDPAAWDVPVRGAQRLAQTLAARRDEALLYRTLATLRTDVPLPESLDDIRWRGPTPAFEALVSEWDVPRLRDRLPEPP
jgi:5'-3' exonuclease